MKKKIISSIIILSIVVVCITINNNVIDKTKIINYKGNNLLVTIDGENLSSLPNSGNYYLTNYECDNSNTKVSWDRQNHKLNVSNGTSTGGVYCNLTFESKPLLSSMPVGSYVAYTGVGGKVGSTSVNCTGNACKGENANQSSDTSGYTYGYCTDPNYKYYTTGWRIAYKTGAGNKAVLVSAGSPECIGRTSSTANVTYIKTANATALKYCNKKFVDGSCTCTSTTSGQCDEKSTDAWAINDYDFYYMTEAISGYGKRLASDSNAASDNLGTTGGILNTAYCYGEYSYKECGYNNDLIDNGGFYWFASRYSSTESYGVMWNPNTRFVRSTTNTDAYGLRPVISLSSSVYVTGGDGTIESPYTIGVPLPLLKDAEVGSYVEYVGNNGCSGNACSGGTDGWRIAYTKDNNPYLISGGVTENISSVVGATTVYTDVKESSESTTIDNSMYYSDSYTFNSNTGIFILNSPYYVDDVDKELEFSEDTPIYTCLSNSTSCSQMYEIYEKNSSAGNFIDALVYTHTVGNTTTGGSPDTAENHINKLNSLALNYCNATYVDGGVCNNTTTWAINDTDFLNITDNTLSNLSILPRYYPILQGNNNSYWYAVSSTDNKIYYYKKTDDQISVASSDLTNVGLRPIIKMDPTIVITGGTGTQDDPYKISKP